MSWADEHIRQLDLGNVVKFRPVGKSMEPIIKSGQEVSVRPRFSREPSVGDIVLCTVGTKQYLHIVKEAKRGLYKIGNNKGGVNGWIPIDKIHGFFER